MQNQPLVSVIITTYSRPDNLVRAIESVLAQTYQNIELIVVDDNGLGTEYQKVTEQTVKKYIDDGKITYIPHDVNRNGSAARNTGFRASKGEYINFLDDDDTFEPDKLEKQVELLQQKSKEFGAVTCNILLVFPRSTQVLNVTEEGNLTASLLLGKQRWNTSTLLFRREVLETLNGFDDSFIRHQDWELMIRFFRKYLLAVSSGSPLIKKYSSIKPALKGKKWMIPVKEKFLSTFKYDIDKLPEKDAIYYYQYKSLLNSLINDGDLSNALKYYKVVKCFGKISILQKIGFSKTYFKGVIRRMIKK